MNTTDSKICPVCGGAGYYLDTKCCETPLKTGECCGNGVPDQQICEACLGSGMRKNSLKITTTRHIKINYEHFNSLTALIFEVNNALKYEAIMSSPQEMITKTIKYLHQKEKIVLDK